MTFDFSDYSAKPAFSDLADGATIRFTDWIGADRKRRQMIDLIEECETVEELDDYYEREAPMVAALNRFRGEMGQAVGTAYADRRIVLKHSG